MVGRAGFFRSFRGASAASEPGIQMQAQQPYPDSGFAAFGRAPE